MISRPGISRHRATPRALRAILTVLLGTLALAACGADQIHTQTYGYDARYYQLGRD
jgi:hypothetical protein